MGNYTMPFDGRQAFAWRGKEWFILSGEVGEMHFLLGAAGYPLLELCWRGRTHPSMALAGGMAMSWLGFIHRKGKDRPLWQLALLGGLGITGIEYGIGQAFNRRFRVWDYRRMPLNVQGQICPAYTLAWCGLSAAVIGIMRFSSAQASAASGGWVRRLPWRTGR